MIPPYYAILYMKLDRIVQRFGWCLSIHGSMTRDLDVILIPWTEDAESEDKVVDAIRVFIEGSYTVAARKRMEKKMNTSSKEGLAHYATEDKPHGRKAFSIYIGFSGYYLDISILPRKETKSE